MSHPSHAAWTAAILILLFTACERPSPPWQGKPEWSYRDQLHLKGAVVHLMEKNWWPEDSLANVATTLTASPNEIEEWFFAPTGQALKFSKWVDGKLEYFGFSVFNDSMQLLEYSHYGSDGKRNNYMAYAYNPDGTQRELQRFGEAGRLNRKVRWEYDDLGRKTAEYGTTYLQHLDGTTSEIRRDYRYHYADSSHLYTISTEYEDGSPVRTTTFKSGVEVSHFNDKGHGYGKSRFDAAGRLIATEEWLEDGTLWQATYNEYDSLGRLIQQRVIQNGSLLSIKHLKYDDNGLVSEERRAMPQLAGTEFAGSDTLHPLVETYRHQLDSMGNWTLKETYHNGILAKVQSRVIEYAK